MIGLSAASSMIDRTAAQHALQRCTWPSLVVSPTTNLKTVIHLCQVHGGRRHAVGRCPVLSRHNCNGIEAGWHLKEQL